jgi:hypothetical protein
MYDPRAIHADKRIYLIRISILNLSPRYFVYQNFGLVFSLRLAFRALVYVLSLKNICVQKA